MSEPERPRAQPDDGSNRESSGPNLKLIYGLIALALALAIGFAALVVLPFWQRR
jgi:hypothetical protein